MKLRILYPFILVFVFLTALLFNLALFNRVYRNSNEEVTVKIARGDNLRSVSRELENKGVIFNKEIFIITGRLLGYQDEIIAGEYHFKNGLTNIDVLKEITDKERYKSVTITIPEGLNIRQIAHLLSRLHGLDSARFVREANNDSLIALLGIKADNLEGYLFPDTYNFIFNTKDNPEREIVFTMAAQFRRKLTGEMKKEMERKKLILKDLITMASIIEGETRYEPEKKIIAGVYYNRLKKKMKLEADPTVQYALPGGWKNVLSYNDLKIKSPYNTYLNQGLPPGPINNPGLDAIKAALEPDNNKYLYFVAKGDGTHRFAETYEQHKKNIQEYKKFLQEQENKKNNKKQ